MAPPSLWSGNLRLSLVLIPVRLIPAVSTEEAISFRQRLLGSVEAAQHPSQSKGAGPKPGSRRDTNYEALMAASELGSCTENRLVAIAPIKPISREGLSIPTSEYKHGAIAVVLDFMYPAITSRRLIY
jgi:hypothetical protein